YVLVCGYLLLERKYVRYHRLQVGIAYLRIGRHWDLAPHAGAALLDLFHQLRGGAGVALVLGGNFDVRRTHELLVDRVAGRTAVLLEEVLARVGADGTGGEHADDGDYGGNDFHRVSGMGVVRAPNGNRSGGRAATTQPGRRG